MAVQAKLDAKIVEALGPARRIINDIADFLEKQAEKVKGGKSSRPNAKNPHNLDWRTLSPEQVRLLSKAQKGLYGEIVSDAYMVETRGFKQLSNPDRIPKHDLEAVPHGQGIDGMYLREKPPPPTYIVTEAKYRTDEMKPTKDGQLSELGTTKGGVKQMSDEWIEDRLKQQADSVETAEKIGEKGYERWVLWVDDSGKVRKIFKLDGNAKVIDTITNPYK